MERHDAKSVPSDADVSRARSAIALIDEVEREIEALDPEELAEFLAADAGPAPRREFALALHTHLREQLRRRFQA